jgi:hypothetical protein
VLALLLRRSVDGFTTGNHTEFDLLTEPSG